MADSKDPEKMRAPVRNMLPIEASAKLKVDVGRARLTISRFKVLRMDRMSSRFGEEM